MLTVGPRCSWASADAASPHRLGDGRAISAGRREQRVERLAGDRLLHDHRDFGQVTDGGCQPQAAGVRCAIRGEGLRLRRATAAALAGSW